MKFSKYNFLFRSEKYGYLLFNAETKAYVRLSEDDFKVLKLIEQEGPEKHRDYRGKNKKHID